MHIKDFLHRLGHLATNYIQSSENNIRKDVLNASLTAWRVNKFKAEPDVSEKIENLRQALSNNHKVINRLDFGIGIGGKPSLLNLFHQGFPSTVSISKLNRGSSKPEKWAALLFWIAKYKQPSRILELGTCFGISTAYMEYGAGKDAEIDTVDGAEEVLEIAIQNFQYLFPFRKINTYSGSFLEILHKDQIQANKYDITYIDGHHHGMALFKYFNIITELMNAKGILIVDDIHANESMTKSWSEIVKSEQVEYHIDLYQLGIIQLK
ncbi:MAG: class I SAM-dependent methyltransferase [Bacteroidota bacterium]|nr:class I SAM-dependent methyltransferase [Bacteroidota bacterium]